MRPSVPRVLGLAAALALWAGGAAVAQAKTIHVGPGDSIQAAVDQAAPGDVVALAPGTYHQNVTITTDGITLRGAGPGVNGSKLRLAATPTPSICTQGGQVNGICIVGQVDNQGNPSGPAVSGTTVTNLSVRGFSGFGVFLFNADDSTIRRVAAVRNGGYGISGFVLHGIRFLSNYAAHNGAPGFYVGDSPDAQAVVLGNTAVANTASGVEGIGFLFRDSSHGSVHGNWARGNCAGFVFVDTGEDTANGATAWRASGNHANRNNAACTAEEGGGAPALSGIGIALWGVQNTNLSGNEADNNVASGPSVPSGGIVVASGVPLGGGPLKGVIVARNSAHGNDPFDIQWDGTGSRVRFVDNDCGSSNPSWICSP